MADAHLLWQNLKVYMYKGIEGAAGKEVWVLLLAGCHVCGNVKGHPAAQHQQISAWVQFEVPGKHRDRPSTIASPEQATGLVTPVYVSKKQWGDAQPF